MGSREVDGERYVRSWDHGPVPEEKPDVVVVGAGAAGLATAALLGKRGVKAIVLERSTGIGASWRGRYDRLRLNTVRWLSGLPGYPLDRRYGRWPRRDGFVAYLERYAEHHDLLLQTGTTVERIDRSGEGWRIETTRGTFTARFVVVATGYDHTPVIPDWPGLGTFVGELVHSGTYLNAEPYRGKDALVVGTGNSGSEIAVDLLEGGAKSVRVSMRTPVNIFPREWLGLPLTPVAFYGKRLPAALVDRFGRVLQRLIFGNLSSHGLPPAPYGLATEMRKKGKGPVVDAGFVEALKRGHIELVPPVEGFDGAEVILGDGRRIRPEIVIAATGYRQGLEPLVGHLGVLEASGRPTVLGDETHPDAPGLYFIGYITPISGQLPEIGATAKRITRSIVRAIAGRPQAG